jgi:hypothetical protein
MQEEGVVSLWIGHADSSDALDAYLLTGYSEDGDFIPSPFARDFGIGYHDEDFREAQHYENPSRFVRVLLRGYSYDNVIIPKFIQLLGELLPEEVNAIVLLYNFKHDASVETNAGGAVRLRYMGAVTLN